MGVMVADAVWMVGLAVAGDLCVYPTTILLSLLPAQSLWLDIASAFITCPSSSSNNPYLIRLQKGSTAMVEMQIALSSSAYSASAYTPLRESVLRTLSLLSSISTQTQDGCPAMSQHWIQIVEESTCTRGIEGVFVVWLMVCMVSLTLLLSIPASSLLDKLHAQKALIFPDDEANEEGRIEPCPDTP
jgi:hypothetical protein